jgi:ubiquinone biosynthesis protein COQ9
LQRLAQEKGMDVAEYAKRVIVEHVKSVVGEL